MFTNVHLTFSKNAIKYHNYDISRASLLGVDLMESRVCNHSIIVRQSD